MCILKFEKHRPGEACKISHVCLPTLLLPATLTLVHSIPDTDLAIPSLFWRVLSTWNAFLEMTPSKRLPPPSHSVSLFLALFFLHSLYSILSKIE